jgi:hypothetical protein
VSAKGPDVLGFARRWVDPPGGNLRSTGGSVLWAYLRPELAIDRAVVVGPADERSVRLLAELATEVLIAGGPDDRNAEDLAARVERTRCVAIEAWTELAGLLAAPTNFALVTLDGATRDGVGALAAPLATLIAGGGSAELRARDPGQLDDVIRELLPTPLRLSATSEPSGARRAPTVPAEPSPSALASSTALLLPPAVHTGEGTELRMDPAGGPVHAEAGTVLLRPAVPGVGSLPEWLVSCTAEAGIPLAAGPWTVRPPRGYASQKVVFTARAEDGSDVVIKVGQERRFNPLLINEFDGLTALQGLASAAVAAPVPLLSTTRDGIAVVLQSRVGGIPFATLPGDSQRAVMRSFVGSLVELAVDSRAEVPGAEVATAFNLLVDRHGSVNRVDAAQLAFLRGQVSVVGASASPFPAVFSHGDPSPYNLLVGDDGQLSLVDFERSERCGMPLWDVWYFLHACSDSTRRRVPRLLGRRTPPLARAGAAKLLPDVNRRMCDALALDPEVVTSLFYAFWVSLAVRETSRHPVGSPSPGRHARTLTWFVQMGASAVSAMLTGRR